MTPIVIINDDARARLALRAFTDLRGNVLPVINYQAFGLAAQRQQCSLVEIADAVSDALGLGWIIQVGDRGFELTSAGREAIYTVGVWDAERRWLLIARPR